MVQFWPVRLREGDPSKFIYESADRKAELVKLLRAKLQQTYNVTVKLIKSFVWPFMATGIFSSCLVCEVEVINVSKLCTFFADIDTSV